MDLGAKYYKNSNNNIIFVRFTCNSMRFKEQNKQTKNFLPYAIKVEQDKVPPP